MTKLNWGLVGGGSGGIATVHRIAALEDELCTLAAGCFSRDSGKNHRCGNNWGVPSARIYEDYEEMAQQEAQRADGIDFCSIATPNATHFPICKAFLSHGISVLCDKPFTFTAAQSTELIALAEQHNARICLSYTYSALPMLQLARALVLEGQIGSVITVNARYARGSRLQALTEGGDVSAIWRLNPAVSGPGGTISDLGTHLQNMIAFTTGLKIKSLSASLTNQPGDTLLDTNASVLLHFLGGASGLLWASQVAAGSNNEMSLRICGTKGALDWNFDRADQLCFSPVAGEVVTYRKFNCQHPSVKNLSHKSSKLETSHEAFASLYRAFALHLLAQKEGKAPPPYYADGKAGLDGVCFVEACVRSSMAGGALVVCTEPTSSLAAGD